MARFTCDRFNCTMEAEACVLRRRNAFASKRRGKFTYLGGEGVCLNCDQGRQIAGQVTDAMVAAYSRGIKRARKNTLDATKTAKEGAVKTRICTDEKCEHKGIPQPETAFSLQNRFKVPMKICKACMRRRMIEGARKRTEKLKAKKKQAPKVQPVVKENGSETPMVSFAKHPDLLARIVETAALEYRSPADQLLWMVRTYVCPVEASTNQRTVNENHR